MTYLYRSEAARVATSEAMVGRRDWLKKTGLGLSALAVACGDAFKAPRRRANNGFQPVDYK